MTDPRTQPNFKQMHMQDKVLLMLGAILDALEDLKAPPAPTRASRKAD
jgi:hypothetical protein